MTVKWQAEVDPYCSKVLAKHWPDVPNLGDVTKIEWEKVERVDLVCGGFPCQPFSSAGKRLGADDPRYLWPEVVRCLRVLRPRFVLMENVAGLVAAPEFGFVLGDLADLGYDTEWDCIPAAAVGAPHLRYRLFVVAYTDSERRDGWPGVFGQARRAESAVGGRALAYAASTKRGAARRRTAELGERGSGERPGDDWWATEPDVGRVAHGVPARVDRLRALGNAVVPQVAEFIGRQLLSVLEEAP